MPPNPRFFTEKDGRVPEVVTQRPRYSKVWFRRISAHLSRERWMNTIQWNGTHSLLPTSPLEKDSEGGSSPRTFSGTGVKGDRCYSFTTFRQNPSGGLVNAHLEPGTNRHPSRVMAASVPRRVTPEKVPSCFPLSLMIVADPLDRSTITRPFMATLSWFLSNNIHSTL